MVHVGRTDKELQNFALSYEHIEIPTSAGIIQYSGPGENGQPPFAKIGVISTQQKGKTIHCGSIRAIDAYKLGKVPRQKFSNNPVETLDDATDTTLTNYQRSLTKKRRKDLSDWFGYNGMNYLATGPLIWLPELCNPPNDIDAGNLFDQGKGYIVQKAGIVAGIGIVQEIVIPVVDDAVAAHRNFVNIRVRRVCNHESWPVDTDNPTPSPYEMENGNWFDYCPKCGWCGKPAEIIDGQHRISGAGTSTKSDQPLPLTLVTGDHFPNTEKAKLFREVTTKAEPLDDLHGINLVYRSRPWADSKVKFASEPSTRTLYTGVISAIRRSPLLNRFHVVKNKSNSKPTGSMASIEQVVRWLNTYELIETWDSINTGSACTAANVSDLLVNWFEAIRLTTGWAGGTTWTTGRGTRGSPLGILNSAPMTEVFCKILPAVIKKHNSPGMPAISDFSCALDYIKVLDFTENSEPRNLTKSGGQKDIDNLVVLISSMIDDLSSPLSPRVNTLTASTWLGSLPRATVDDFDVVATLPATGAITSASPLRINWNVTSYDLVSSSPAGPLNSHKQLPSVRVYDAATSDEYYNEVQSTGGRFVDIPQLTDSAGVSPTSGTILTVEVTFDNIVKIGPSRTESDTFSYP